MSKQFYIIVPSEGICDFLRAKKVADNVYDLAWFVSEDKALAEKVMDFFEKFNGQSEMVQAMTLITDALYTRIRADTYLKKFRVLEVGDDYWPYVESIVPPKPELRQTDHATVMDFICVEGVNRAFRFGGKVRTQKEHDKCFNKTELRIIRTFFDNPNII
jgi:hypothetical protein